jgi:hypothetical protein
LGITDLSRWNVDCFIVNSSQSLDEK